MPDITTEVKSFQDMEKATFAHIQVNNMEGLPVKYIMANSMVEQYQEQRSFDMMARKIGHLLGDS